MNVDFAQVKNKLYNFFMGKWYPILVAVMVTLAHITGAEMYFAIVNILLAVTALCVCDSIRPLFVVVATFTFQVSEKNSPAAPTFSDYYFTGWRIYAVIILAALVVFGLTFFIVRNKLWKKLSLRKTTLLIPALVLSAAFLLNGVGSDNWSLEGFGFGASQIIIYLILYLLFYLGLSEKDGKDELVNYVTYIALVTALALLAQVIYQFAFGDVISNGQIDRSNLNLGWVTCNPLGGLLVTFIPVMFYGAITQKYGWLYFVTATLSFIGAVATCSRNSLVFGTLAFAVCFIIACIKGKERRKYFVWALVICVLAALAMFTLFYDKLAVIFQRYVTSGMNDSGRFVIWGRAWDIFCDNVVFGNGFFAPYAPGLSVVVEFMPGLAHNTIFEFLASTGLVGMAAYSYYRIETIKVMLKRPTLDKIMLGMSVLVVAAQSLLDSFIFFYYPMLLPTAILAVICRVYDVQMEEQERFFKDLLEKQQGEACTDEQTE